MNNLIKKINKYRSSVGVVIALVVVFVVVCVVLFTTNTQNIEVEPDPNATVTDTIKCSTFKFKFDNHGYIKFKSPEGNYIIHDPSCGCMSKRLNNITTVITNNDNKHLKDITTQLNAMQGQLKNLKEELDKKPKVIYITKPAPAKPTVVLKKTMVPVKKPTPKKR